MDLLNELWDLEWVRTLTFYVFAVSSLLTGMLFGRWITGR